MLIRISKYMYIGILLLVIVLCFSIFSNAQDKKWKIGFISEGFQGDYGVLLAKGAQDLAEQLGNIDLIVMDGQFSSDIQLNQMENLVAQKCDLIMVQPDNAKAMGAKAQWVQSMGIPVMAVSIRLDPDSCAYCQYGDELAVAIQQNEMLAKAIGYKGQILSVRGLPGASYTIARDAGTDYILKKYPDIKLLDSKPANSSRDLAFTLMQGFLQAYPKIDGVVVHTADMTTAVVQAIKAAGREGIIVVGMDGSKEEIANIKAGNEYGTMALDPYGVGKQAIYLAIFILSQENKDLWKQMKGGISCLVPAVTKENVEMFKGF